MYSERTPEVDSDPFDADCDDPKTCHALDSCLWELQVIHCSMFVHYNPYECRPSNLIIVLK